MIVLCWVHPAAESTSGAWDCCQLLCICRLLKARKWNSPVAYLTTIRYIGHLISDPKANSPVQNKNPDLLLFEDGVVDLRTKKLRSGKTAMSAMSGSITQSATGSLL